MADEDAYGGVFGAFPYAWRSSDSWLFRTYVVVGGLAAVLSALLFVFGVIEQIAETSVPGGGTLSLAGAFFIIVALAVVVPIVAPVLFVARRHRHGLATRGYDVAMGAVGFAFLASLYAALIVSVPPGQQESVGGFLAPVVRFLYALPQAASLGVLAIAAGAILVVHRVAGGRTRPTAPVAAAEGNGDADAETEADAKSSNRGGT
jgi:hypothetical protein